MKIGGDLGLTTHFEYETMFEHGRIDIAQPDVTMVGGLTELLRLSAIAKARGLGVSVNDAAKPNFASDDVTHEHRRARRLIDR